MRTIIQIAILVVGLFTIMISADPIKGEKLLNRMVHDDCQLPAPRVAMVHSLAEWDRIYTSGKMEEEIQRICQGKKPLPKIREKYAKYIYEYMEHYANDSGAIPA